MFTATVTEQIVTVISSTGNTAPAGREKWTLIGKQFADRAAAIKACEHHFSALKASVQRKNPGNSLISQSTLAWQGNSATPEIPLGIRDYDNPPVQVYEVVYSVLTSA